LRNNSLMLKIS